MLILTRPALKSRWAVLASGSAILTDCSRSMPRLASMKDASRKNMMSISGMISIRAFRRGNGEPIFMTIPFGGPLRRRNRKGRVLYPHAAHEVQHTDDPPVSGLVVTGDVHRHVGVQMVTIGEILCHLHVVVSLLVNAQITKLVHRDIDDVGLGAGLSDGGGGQIHLQGLQPHHAQARQHERRQQEKHDVYQRNDLDPRLLLRPGSADSHKRTAGLRDHRTTRLHDRRAWNLGPVVLWSRGPVVLSWLTFPPAETPPYQIPFAWPPAPSPRRWSRPIPTRTEAAPPCA